MIPLDEYELEHWGKVSIVGGGVMLATAIVLRTARNHARHQREYHEELYHEDENPWTDDADEEGETDA